MVQLDPLFGPGAVLPAGKPLRVSGSAGAGRRITVRYRGASASARADGDGRWWVELSPMTVGDPGTLVVEADGRTQAEAENVCVGELWLCAGQSNMAMALGATDPDEREAALAPAGDARLRVLTVPRRVAFGPVPLSPVSWHVADAGVLDATSAVAVHAGQWLRRRRENPVGLVVAALGHTPIESWIAREALVAEPTTRPLVGALECLRAAGAVAEAQDHFERVLEPRLKAWERVHGPWLAAARAAHRAGEPVPPMPPRPTGVSDPHQPSLLFNGMIAPLTASRFTGVLWYQGESNAILGRGPAYGRALRALIHDWRRKFDQPRLPFGVMQLPGHWDVQTSDPDRQWPAVREGQRRAAALPGVGLAVGLDLGERYEIHPPRKREAAVRLMNAAGAEAYGWPEAGGVLPGPATAQGGRVEIHFSRPVVATSLETLAGTCALAGPDGVDHRPRVHLAGATLSLEAGAVPGPRRARYAFAADPPCVLRDGAGLPAAPFELRFDESGDEISCDTLE